RSRWSCATGTRSAATTSRKRGRATSAARASPAATRSSASRSGRAASRSGLHRPLEGDQIDRANIKRVNLAMQGGGAHGAFGWGVLDKLAEDGRLDIEGLSASSSGSMNAAVYAHGRSIGGLEGAREALEKFWRNVSAAG